MKREEALRRVKGYLTDCLPSEDYDEVEEIMVALNQQKEGNWIPMGIVDENGNRNYECSECHHSDVQAASMTVPYCWFCGARMKGGK